MTTPIRNIQVDLQINWSLFSTPLVFIDLETIGGKAQKDSIIEIAAIRCEPNTNQAQMLSTLISVQDVGNLQRIHQISQSDVEGAPTFQDIAPYLIEVLDGATIVAHNANFEHRFLKAEFDAIGCTYACPNLCTLKFAKALLTSRSGKGAHTLTGLLEYYKIQSSGIAHYALTDVYNLIELTQKLFIDAIQQQKMQTLLQHSLVSSTEKSIWQQFTRKDILLKDRGTKGISESTTPSVPTQPKRPIPNESSKKYLFSSLIIILVILLLLLLLLF